MGDAHCFRNFGVLCWLDKVTSDPGAGSGGGGGVWGALRMWCSRFSFFALRIRV